jgi:hypothetical protein
MATITLKIVPFRRYAPFPALLPLLNSSWKSCSVREFRTACDSASIASVVSKWRPFSFIFNWGNREKQGRAGTTAKLLLVKNSLVKKEV